jgi:hypothetical protein
MARALLRNSPMMQVDVAWKPLVREDEAKCHPRLLRDPDDDDEWVDSETLALRDAVRDIVADQGRFEILFY